MHAFPHLAVLTRLAVLVGMGVLAGGALALAAILGVGSLTLGPAGLEQAGPAGLELAGPAGLEQAGPAGLGLAGLAGLALAGLAGLALGTVLLATGAAIRLGLGLARDTRLLQASADALAGQLAAAHVDLLETNAELDRTCADLAAVTAEARELAAREAHRRAVVDSLADGVLILDVRGVIEDCNLTAEALFGAPAGTLVGASLGELIPSLEELPSTPSTLEVEGCRADGTRLPLELALQPLASPDDARGRQVAVVRDVSERTRARAALVATRDAALDAARQKSAFLATMSHEIRTPMNGVIGMAGLLLDTPLDGRQRAYTEAIQRSGEALLTVIEDILDFSKSEAGKLQLEAIEVDVRQVVEDVIELLTDQARTRGINLAYLVEPSIPQRLLGDPGRLRQVLINLIGNAIKFTPAGEVLVFAHLAEHDERGSLLAFEVADTGIGIEPAVQARLFQPFTQADGSTARKYGGTGLGLAICKQLAELMGGQIGVRSEPGHGSTFWFSARLAAASAVRRPRSLSRELVSPRVLVVDDNARSRTIVREQVAGWSMLVDEAEDAPQALAALRAAAADGQAYAAALVNVQLAGMDGIELARAVAAEPALARTRLVLLGAVGRPDHLASARAAGLGVCLSKPVRPSELLEALAGPEPAAPAEAQAVEASGPRPTALYGAAWLGSSRVLVVEDSPINQQVTLGLLEKFGLQADVAQDGAEALALLAGTGYAAVLMDLQMPGLDGFEATREIRRREGATQHTPIIAMTANALPADRDRCLEAGMDDYVSKPVRPAELAAALRRWVAQAPSSGSEPAPVDEAVLEELPASLRDQMVSLYLEEATAALASAREAAACGDLDALRQTAHRLRGDAATVGALEVAACCGDLEACARDGAGQRVTELMSALEAALGRSRVSFEALGLRAAA